MTDWLTMSPIELSWTAKKNLLLMHLSCILVICITIYRVNMYNFIQSIHICFVFVEEGGAIGFLWDDSAYHWLPKTLFVTYQAAPLEKNGAHVVYVTVEDRSHIFPRPWNTQKNLSNPENAILFFVSAPKGSCQKLLSGFCPLRGVHPTPP